MVTGKVTVPKKGSKSILAQNSQKIDDEDSRILPTPKFFPLSHLFNIAVYSILAFVPSRSGNPLAVPTRHLPVPGPALVVHLAVLVVAGGVVQRRAGVAVHAVGVVVVGLCLDVVVPDLHVLGGVQGQT